MSSIKRLALAPVAALALTGLAGVPAHADSSSLSAEAVEALAVAECQADPEVPLSAEELAPVVVGEADVEVVPGEISVHVVRLDVNPADPAECTVGVLHRDAQLARVQYEGTVTLAGTATEVELGNLGRSAPVDPTTEVVLLGSLVPAGEVAEDPAYDVALVRKSLQTVSIAVHRAEKDAAAKRLKAEEKAAAVLLRKQEKAAGHGKNAEKRLAAAQKAFDKRMAAAEAAYLKATTPKTVTRPVGVAFTASGTVARF